MMSSEEDTAECFGLYGDKLLSSKKSKRTRQRVDAGEPRNSYSSIPNFSSRPSFMSGGLYGALLSQSQQHFGGLFGPNGFGSAKMLNELFGRQVKSAQDASSGPESMLSMESASSTEGAALAGTVAVGANSANSTGGSGSGKLGFESAASSNNSSPVIRRRTSSSGVETDGGGSTPPQSQAQSQQQHQNDLAHHMLRNILQGKKEQLMALDHELRSVAAAAAQNSSPDNNNSISKNNNTSSNNNNNSSTVNSNNNSTNNSGNCAQQDVKSEVVACATKVNNVNAGSGTVAIAAISAKKLNLQEQKNSEELNCANPTGSGANTGDAADEASSRHGESLPSDRVSSQLGVAMKKERDDLLDEDEEMMGLNSSHSDLESLGSVDSMDADDVRMKEELIEADMNLEKELGRGSPLNEGVGGGSSSGKEPVALDMKRARVENIVSTMRSSPSLASQPQVNGCKKRKLYQPQQHDNSAAERYAAVAAGLNLNIGLNMHGIMIDDDDEAELESPQIQQKRDEKNALKSQLRSMQEQLAEMQQKYVQLCSRMEQESECQEIDDTGSDIADQDGDQDDNNESPSAEKTHSERPSPLLSPLKESAQKNDNTPNMLSQMMTKMMSTKMRNALGSHHHMAQPFNGAHPLLQHIHHSGIVNDHNMPSPHMSHHAISNAAAMYLGQKFFLEQEARLVKEAAEHHGRQQLHQSHHQQQQQHHHQQQQQLHQQHQPHHHQQKQNQQQQQQIHHQAHQEMQSQPMPQHQPQPHQVQQQPPQQSQSQFQSIAQASQSQQSQQLSQQQVSENAQTSGPGHHHPSPQASQPSSLRQSPMTKVSTVQSDLSEKFNIIRSSTNSVGPMSGSDLEGLADILKSEITASLSTLVDSIVTRFVHQRRYLGKQSEAAAAAAEQLNKDLLMASQLLDRKSPRIKVADRSTMGNGLSGSSAIGNNAVTNGVNQSGNGQAVNSTNGQATHSLSHSSNSMLSNQSTGQRLNGTAFPPMGLPMHVNGQVPSDSSNTNNLNSLNIPPPHVRPSPSAAMFQAPKPPQPMNSVAAAALYNSMSALNGHANQMNPFCMPEPRDQNMEQNEALSLVVTPKKKRHKVTDTRITPRTVSRILAQDGIGPPPANQLDQQHQQQQQISSNASHNKYNNQQLSGGPLSSTASETPSPRSSYPPPPAQAMMPVSLPTTVAIPNPSLHESQVFSPYSPFFTSHGPHGPHGPHAPQPSQLHHLKMSSSPPGLCGMLDSRDSPPLSHPQTMLHPALLAAAHHSGSPDYGHLRAAMDTDRNSDCNSGDISFDGVQPTISFSNTNRQSKHYISLTAVNSSTLTPMHLRKAKLMFFWVRYPSSAVLKMYFPDIKFNKNNTAQLVKWFSNFREFYYIQMEKYARQAITEGVKNADDLHVNIDSELYRVLNLHYNRNNHIEVPQNFRYVVEQTLREFFRAIQSGKDAEQSWKKSIYKIISRLDDPVPEYFKSPNFLEQLE